MLASFIIRYHTRRLDNLLQTLRFLERWHLSVIQDSEVLLICHDRCGAIKTAFGKTHNFNMESSEMSMAPQLNFGVKQSKSDLIILLDSDRILPEGYFEKIIDSIQKRQMVSTLRMNRVMQMVSDENIIAGDFPRREEWRSQDNKPSTRNIFSGNVVFWKDEFYEAGEADENYIGYGWEDHDMTRRMSKVGVESVFCKDEVELHLWHELVSYGVKDQKKLFIDNGIRYCKNWKLPYPKELVTEIQKYSKVFL